MTDKMDSRFEWVGTAARTLRKDKDLTQTALAEKAGMAITIINRLENEYNNVTIGTLFKLADALEVHPAAFFGADSNEVMAMARLWRMPEEQRALIFRLVGELSKEEG